MSFWKSLKNISIKQYLGPGPKHGKIQLVFTTEFLLYWCAFCIRKDEGMPKCQCLILPEGFNPVFKGHFDSLSWNFRSVCAFLFEDSDTWNIAFTEQQHIKNKKDKNKPISTLINCYPPHFYRSNYHTSIWWFKKIIDPQTRDSLNILLSIR